MFENLVSNIIGLAKGVHDAMDRALQDAYQRGLADGREQAKKEFRERVEGVFKEELPRPTVTLETSVPHKVSNRAPKGSVEPAVITALEISHRGMKPIEISGHAGVPENSVRSMLNKLRVKGRVEKRGELWFLKRKSAEDAPNNEPSADLIG